MTLSTLAILGATIVFSSFLSGVFGMAGGMILLGVLLNYFDVATGMILFSIIQLFANGWRALQWRVYVLWPIFFSYVLGSVISFAAMWTVAFVPNKAMVYLALGLCGWFLGNGAEHMFEKIPSLMLGKMDHIIHIILGVAFLAGGLLGGRSD